MVFEKSNNSVSFSFAFGLSKFTSTLSLCSTSLNISAASLGFATFSFVAHLFSSSHVHQTL
jgi:hypothetical protein